MAESEREIEVRSLAGESTTVMISPNSSIQDLKLLLKQSFPPAKQSQNFHLFLKGAKMTLESRISSYSVETGEFIVLLPFNKKDRSQTQHQNSDQTVTFPEVSNRSTASSFADSAWSDMMQDISFLSDKSTKEFQSETSSSGIDAPQSDNVMAQTQSFVSCSSGSKRRRGLQGDRTERFPDELIQNLFRCSIKDFLGEKCCKGFLAYLESVNCLSDLHSGKCLLSSEAGFLDKDTGVSTEKTSSCMCPPWLRTILKAFAFLNVFSGYLQMQREDVTWDRLKETLKHLQGFGLEVCIADVESLSLLCPKVVRFGNQEIETPKLGDAIVIVDSSKETDVQFEKTNDSRSAQKQVPISTIISTTMKRDKAFKTKLWRSIKSLMGKAISRNGMTAIFSLEDLLVFMGGGVSSNGVTKSAMRSCSLASNFHSLKMKCQDTNPLLPMEMVEHLRNGIGSQGQIVHVEQIGSRMAVHSEIPNNLSEITRSALERIGVSRLYRHQAESIKASLSGKNVIVATMTSSGKSLCYNLPVIEVLSHDVLSCALYLFPTKALAQDQLRALLNMTRGSDISSKIGVYDGDTCQEERVWLRDNARLLISNPDMLHMSILPFHGQFQRILSNLRFVIIDEAHAYKGAFGCHTALILRRLRRLCSHVYGSDPSFVLCTATSANPLEHSMELTNLPELELIQNDGSPSGAKLFVLWNPPFRWKTVSQTSSGIGAGNPEDKNVAVRRSSPIMEVSYLFAEMVQHGLRCIAFCRSRKLCELVLSYTREILQETAPKLTDSICAYRAGYIPKDRRRIESEFFGGKLCGITATNALELGIDVGHIDATLHLGFPGSIASLWQQAGRSGRREKPSLAVYVAFEGPLDQYFMKFPKKLFGSPIECCHVDARNQQVLEQHLVCAALEHPLSLLYDERYFGSGLSSAIMNLKSKGCLSSDPSRNSSAQIWSYIGHEKMPSRAIIIRAIETEKYKVIDQKRNEVLEEIEESRAFFQVYEGAVYMHQGRTYLIKILDLSNKFAFCQECDLKYYTKTRDYTDIHVIGGDIAYPSMASKTKHMRTTAQAQTCKVTTTWFGFHRIRKGSNQIFDTVDLSLPKYSYESQAVWIRVPQSVKAAVEIKRLSFRAGLHAASHALLNIIPLYIVCNSSDLASECVNPHETRYIPERILLYDQHPGGIGVSKQVQPLFPEMLTAALELITTCCCSGDKGCPNCVQNLACREYNEVLQRDAAIMILEGVIRAEDAAPGRCRETMESCTAEFSEPI